MYNPPTRAFPIPLSCMRKFSRLPWWLQCYGFRPFKCGYKEGLLNKRRTRENPSALVFIQEVCVVSVSQLSVAELAGCFLLTPKFHERITVRWSKNWHQNLWTQLRGPEGKSHEPSTGMTRNEKSAVQMKGESCFVEVKNKNKNKN